MANLRRVLGGLLVTLTVLACTLGSPTAAPAQPTAAPQPTQAAQPTSAAAGPAGLQKI